MVVVNLSRLEQPLSSFEGPSVCSKHASEWNGYGGGIGPATTVAPVGRQGFLCPVPVAKTREALEELKAGAVLEVLADDPETLQDMPMLIGRGPHRLVNVRENGGEIRFLIQVVATS